MIKSFQSHISRNNFEERHTLSKNRNACVSTESHTSPPSSVSNMSVSSLTKSLFHDTCKVSVTRLERQLRDEENKVLKQDFFINIGRLARNNNGQSNDGKGVKQDIVPIDTNLKELPNNFQNRGEQREHPHETKTRRSKRKRSSEEQEDIKPEPKVLQTRDLPRKIEATPHPKKPLSVLLPKNPAKITRIAKKGVKLDKGVQAGEGETENRLISGQVSCLDAFSTYLFRI